MFECESCKREFALNDMRYNPYEKKRYCKDCFQRINKKTIFEPVKIEKKSIIDWEEEEQ